MDMYKATVEYLTDMDSMAKAFRLDEEVLNEIRTYLVEKYGRDGYHWMLEQRLNQLKAQVL